MGKLNGRKIEAMYRLYGPGPADKTCGECNNCIRVTPTDRHYNKCRIYGDTACEATDWRQKWPACGMFNRESGEIPVIERLKHERRPKIRMEIEGQTRMF